MSLLRYNLRHLFVVFVAVSVAICLWHVVPRKHAAHANALYESASFSRHGQIRAGSSKLLLKLVARSDRDSTVKVEDGFGNSIIEEPRFVSDLKHSGPWLDTAQVEFDHKGTDYAVRRLRIFESESRQLISDDYSGQRVADLQTVQIFRIGEKLPDKLDVWMELRSYPDDERVFRIPATVGAERRIGSGKVTLARIYRIGDGAETVFELNWKGQSPPDFDLVAVCHTRNRLRYPSELGFYENGDEGPDRTGRALFKIDPSETIDYLELRHTDINQTAFFFDGVELPKTSNRKFASPPTVSLVDGEIANTGVAEFLPLDVKIRSFAGAGGVSYLSRNQDFMSLRLPNEPRQSQAGTTIAIEIDGLTNPWVQLTANPDSTNPVAIRRYTKGSIPGHAMSFFQAETPIHLIKNIQMKIRDPL